jgi:PKD repeat protein/murein DD-endopeptidase MepM/ murein hydrolase activator NlpD
MQRKSLWVLVGLIGVAVALSLAAVQGAPAGAQIASGVESPGEQPDLVVLAGVPPASYRDYVYQPSSQPLSEEEEQRIRAEVDANIARLAAQGKLPAREESVTLDWPLRLSRELSDPGYHAVSGLVDHDPDYPGHVLDYNCGSRTYDMDNGYNHEGSDYFSWPFPWLKVETNGVEVVAAAPGTIVGKQDGQYDRQCTWTGSDWNAVQVRHADGSVAWYGHLKNGSLTDKPIGSQVAAGEYLGIVASSGRSSGPHLHFQLERAGQVVDPYHGPCNAEPTWWAAQRDYYDSAVNALMTGDAAPEFPECPNPEQPHVEDSFNPGQTVYFSVFFRDVVAGQVVEYAIYRPDGSVFSNWSRTIQAEHYAASGSSWSHVLPTNAPTGTWRLEVAYVGTQHETYFNVGVPTSVRVTAPNGGETWAAGSTHTVTWEDNLGGNVRIELYQDGVYHTTLAKSTPSDGAFEWVVPGDLAQASGLKVRITDQANPARYDESDAPFSVTQPGSSLQASFTVTPTSGLAPLRVVFTDTSSGDLTGWLWHFGDTFTSTVSSPEHVYTQPGNFTVTLTVSGLDGSGGSLLVTDTLIRSNYIHVLERYRLFIPVLYRD